MQRFEKIFEAEEDPADGQSNKFPDWADGASQEDSADEYGEEDLQHEKARS